jgi:Fe-S-cluster containining protein
MQHQSNNENTPGGNDKGEWLLSHPVLPLVQIVQFLYFTGPFETVSQVLDELVEPIETGTAVYDKPTEILAPYLPALQNYELMKGQGDPDIVPAVYDEQGNRLEWMAALEAWVNYQVLTMELEPLNSVLCHPCGCVLCCTGPDEQDAEQEFFEIPLSAKEVSCFDLSHYDTEQTRQSASLDEPPLQIEGIPFYQQGRAIYRWKTGWSMILPRAAACPGLDTTTGSCRIYPDRPDVCRRPQIFNYILERKDGDSGNGYVLRNKVLAVWDCPYVQRYKDEIASFIEVSGLEPVFRQNKK